MRRLAVFVGDFTAEAASVVAADNAITASAVLGSLANLVTKSLVSLDVGSAVARYRLHETTRAYAVEKLAESGEIDHAGRRHADYCRDLFDKAETELETLPAAAWLAGYGHHIGEVRAALDWAFSPTGAPKVGVALTVAAGPLWVELSGSIVASRAAGVGAVRHRASAAAMSRCRPNSSARVRRNNVFRGSDLVLWRSGIKP
jgi:predicted ATPase